MSLTVYNALNNFPQFGKSTQRELLYGTAVSGLENDISDIELQILELASDIEQIVIELENVVHSVVMVSTYNDVNCPAVPVVDLFDAVTQPSVGVVQLNMRPLFSSDLSVTIDYNSTCGFIDLRAVGGGGPGISNWSSVIDNTGSKVLRYNLLDPSMIGTETLIAGVQNMDTPGQQMFFDLYDTGAFRVGNYTGTQWFKANLGALSFACGQDNIALGLQSFIGGGQYNSALAENCAVFGYSNLADSMNSGIFGGSFNSVSGLSDNGFIGGGTNNTLEICLNSAIVGGSTISGQMHNTFITGSNAIVGVGSETGGPVTAPIDGSFAAFDHSQTEPHFLNSSFMCKQMYRNGFVRGGGSKTHDGAQPSQLGNDGAREVMKPARFVISAGATKTFFLPLSDNHIAMVRGFVQLAVENDFSKRGSFQFEGGVFVRANASPTAIMDMEPTIFKNSSVPLSLFDVSDFIFDVSGISITISITAPVSETIVVNLVLYMYDLI